MSELLKKRYRVTLDFELTANDNAIINSGNADDVKQWDLALLHQFLKDNNAIRYLAAEYIALDMGFLTIEDYEKHLGVGDKSRREVFAPSIDALPPDVRVQWEATQDDEGFEWTLEGITDCFNTSLINTAIEEIKASNDSPETTEANNAIHCIINELQKQQQQATQNNNTALYSIEETTVDDISALFQAIETFRGQQ